jgi:hypothetical protein
MRRTETRTIEAKYCDICLEQGEENIARSICRICKRDLCYLHVDRNIADYATEYARGTNSSFEICEECADEGEKYLIEIEELNHECLERYKEIYAQWEIAVMKRRRKEVEMPNLSKKIG